MGGREPNSLVAEWINSGWMIAVGGTGVILIVLGFKRDDAIGPVFIIAGIAMVVLGFGGRILGVSL